MIIKTERLILRPWTEADAESLYEYAKDPAVGPIAGWPVHTSVDNSRDIINEVLSADETYAICLKEDNIAIGSIGLIPPAQSHTEASSGELEVGYWIGVPFWGKGYMPEAVKAILKHAFEDLNCTAIWCGFYAGNERSKRCQEKCGFTYHHTEENKPCILMGDTRTEHFTYLTKEQWLSNVRKESVLPAKWKAFCVFDLVFAFLLLLSIAGVIIFGAISAYFIGVKATTVSNSGGDVVNQIVGIIGNILLGSIFGIVSLMEVFESWLNGLILMIFAIIAAFNAKVFKKSDAKWFSWVSSISGFVGGLLFVAISIITFIILLIAVIAGVIFMLGI